MVGEEFGIPFIFPSFLLMWYATPFQDQLARFAYSLFTYIFFASVITMVMIPYNALAPELTLDYSERISLNSFRVFFCMLSSVLCAVLPLEIVKRFATPKAGFAAMGAFFGAFVPVHVHHDQGETRILERIPLQFQGEFR